MLIVIMLLMLLARLGIRVDRWPSPVPSFRVVSLACLSRQVLLLQGCSCRGYSLSRKRDGL